MFKLSRFAVLLAGIGLAFAALAQDNGATDDPPGRVARLSYIQGNVSFVPAGDNDWVQAPLNRPLITGDKLWTDNDSRASLEIGTAAVRMDQNTSFDFLNLTDDAAQMELTQGTMNVRVRRLYDGQSYEVDTPTLAFVANRVGAYRIDVVPDGQSTVVTVLSGGGDVYGEGGARFSVEEGQSVVFHNPQLSDYQVNSLPRPDAFDDFCHTRDTRWDNSGSRRYVSEDVIGYQDLDDNGQWATAPEYGNVWYPTTVAVGWSPYHYGHWGWVGAYGWSWIDDAPWGFAPFHYGRWVSVGGRWGWCPGPIAVRPVYAPALVAFVGGGGGLGISVSVGGPIGWFPLGWGEPYIPAYRVSRGYFDRVNVSNTVINNTVINNYYGGYSRGNFNYAQVNYANRGIAGAVTAVPAAAFVGARPVAGAAIAVNANTFANARVGGFAAIAPTRASLVPAMAARAVPTAAVVNRPIVAATRPPAPVASFAQRQQQLAQNPGRPLNVQQLRGPAIAAGAVGAGAAAHAIATRPNVQVVTKQGVPSRTAAPAIPRTANAHPTATANPQSQQITRETPRTGTAVTTNRAPVTTTHSEQATQRLNSAGFAHQQGNANAQNNARQQTNRTVERGASTNRSVESASGNRSNTPVNRSQTRTPAPQQESSRTPAQQPRQQEYRAPQQQSQRAPAQQQQSRQPQEYRAPQQQTQRAPVQQQQPRQQEYRAPQQAQRAQPAQQRGNPPPEKKKEDDKDHH